MANLTELSIEMSKLKKQIETLLRISKYREHDDLSGLGDSAQPKTADQLQQLEEYRRALDKLDEVQYRLEYLEMPIREASRIYRNETGRYETDHGHYYTSGSSIEFLRTEEVYNDNSGKWEDSEIWTRSTVESKDGEYYIVGYPDIELSGLKVRVRRVGK